jgi:opacity protein-like surface antigen
MCEVIVEAAARSIGRSHFLRRRNTHPVPQISIIRPTFLETGMQKGKDRRVNLPIFKTDFRKRNSPMLRKFIAASAAALVLVPAAASAQDSAPATGAYGVLRAGLGIDADLRLKPVDLASPTTLRSSADGKRGWAGEIGMGYNFGGFRLEATGGYARNSLDRKSVTKAAAFDAGGRLSKLDFLVSGYVDLVPNSTITPYIGAGIGAVRISSNLQRTAGLVGGTTLKDRDWGFTYHGTAGVAVKLGETATIDLGIRHQRVTGIQLDGTVGTPAVTRSFKTNGYRSTTALVGLRFGF